MAVLESSSGFMSHIRTEIDPDRVGPLPTITFFTPSNPYNVTLYRKSRWQRGRCYLKEGSFIEYRANLYRAQSSVSYFGKGCVRWFFSVGTCQYLVVQRLQRVNGQQKGMKRGDDIVDKLKEACCTESVTFDTVTDLATPMLMAESGNYSEHSSYDVLLLFGRLCESLSQSDGTPVYPVESHLFVQPDLRHSVPVMGKSGRGIHATRVLICPFTLA